MMPVLPIRLSENAGCTDFAEGTNMTDIMQVQTTTDQRESALAIAEDLVGSGLAACVQIGGPITSLYRWRGNVETASEWTCTIKTTVGLYPAVEQRIRQLHTYEEPEIIAVEIAVASTSYLNWLRAQLAAPDATP